MSRARAALQNGNSILRQEAGICRRRGLRRLLQLRSQNSGSPNWDAPFVSLGKLKRAPTLTSKSRIQNLGAVERKIHRITPKQASAAEKAAASRRTPKLKRAEDPPPAHFAGMQDGVGIGEEALAKLARFPGFRGNVERHVDHDRSSDNVVARDAAPEAAVVRIGAIVAHDEITVGRNF